jgi:hypothetical protein
MRLGPVTLGLPVTVANSAVAPPQLPQPRQWVGRSAYVPPCVALLTELPEAHYADLASKRMRDRIATKFPMWTW